MPVAKPQVGGLTLGKGMLWMLVITAGWFGVLFVFHAMLLR